MKYISKTTRLAVLLIAGIFIAVNGFAQTFLTNGLVAYYPFNGNANDASGNGHNASVNTNTVLTADRFGIPNAAYHFQNAMMQFTNIPVNLAGPCSFGFWMRLNAFDDGYEIAELNTTDFQCNGNPVIWQGNAGVWWTRCGGVGSGTNSSFGLVSGLTNTWHHLFACVASGGVTTIYRDGQVTTNTLESFPITTLANLTLGGAGNLSAGYQNSRVDLDDVRIYNRALTANQVAQLYAFESTPILNIRRAVYLDSSNLWVGSNYQVQVSSDLVNWTNSGAAFTATNSYWRSTNYWDVANWNQLFFRLH